MADGSAGLGRLISAGIGFFVAGLASCLIGVIDENRSPAAVLVPGGSSVHGVLFIAVGPDGRLYRTEGDNADQIVRVEPDGRTTVVASGIKDLGGMAIDTQGDVFVSEDLSNQGSILRLVGQIVEFEPNGTQRVIATMASPTSLAVDQHGVVYVVDGFSRLEEVLPGAQPEIIAQDPQVDPQGLAVAPSGDLYVSDGDHATIWKRDASGKLQPLVQPGLVPDPSYLAVDARGDVYVCQTSFAVNPLGLFGAQRALQVPVLIIDREGAIHRLGVRGNAAIFSTQDVGVSPGGDVYLNDGSSVSELRAPVQMVPVETRSLWELILSLGAVLVGLGLALGGSGLLIRIIEDRSLRKTTAPRP